MCGIFFYHGPAPKEQVQKSFDRLAPRGPDFHILEQQAPGRWMGFHRLAVMGPGPSGRQPFRSHGRSLVCNGEIYNYREILTDYRDRFPFQSHCDCEVLLPLLEDQGALKALDILDGEFAFIMTGPGETDVMAARDPMGIRPLFYGYSETGNICFASEIKALQELCDKIRPFPPGHYYSGGEFHPFLRYRSVTPQRGFDLEKATAQIKNDFEQAVIKRLHSDVPMGFLLSGGLDSSLVCAVAARHTPQRLRTFSVGLEGSAIDTKYAREVADHLGSEHHEVMFSRKQALELLPELIACLETWDITTIRASIGMYLVCRYIREKTDIKVVHTGEVSDELFGYKYTDYAPHAHAFQQEAYKRIEELYLYDVLRADRCISGNSLEARVPFSDKVFVKTVMGLDPHYKMNIWGQGKFLLRRAFAGQGHLPDSILYREKAAFSDAVGHSLVDDLKAHAEEVYTDPQFSLRQKKYTYCPPFSKEALLYRDIFESHFPGSASLIPAYWMPNKQWENCDVDDPSARVLPNYGASGS